MIDWWWFAYEDNFIMKLGLVGVGWRSALVWNVWHICSISGSCCELSFNLIMIPNGVWMVFEFRIGWVVCEFWVIDSSIQLGMSDFQVGMEFWARWAHRALWHASLWHMHEVCFQLVHLSSESCLLTAVYVNFVLDCFFFLLLKCVMVPNFWWKIFLVCSIF